MADLANKTLIRLSKSCLSDAEKQAVMGVLDREYLGMGAEVQQFEEELLDFFGKIVLIPQADPGYDWLFGHKIAGLITKYGAAEYAKRKAWELSRVALEEFNVIFGKLPDCNEKSWLRDLTEYMVTRDW